jgi:hypothetical protein
MREIATVAVAKRVHRNGVEVRHCGSYDDVGAKIAMSEPLDAPSRARFGSIGPHAVIPATALGHAARPSGRSQTLWNARGGSSNPPPDTSSQPP